MTLSLVRLRSITLFALLGSWNYTQAQKATAELVGTVKDSTGKFVIGATVKLTDVDTQIPRTIVTNDAGFFTLTSIPAGRYDLEATSAGFQKKRLEGITLAVDQRARLDIDLSVGALEQVIEVQGVTPMVNTEDATVGSVTTEKAIQQLPLNGRNFTQLIGLTPGVTAGTDVGVGIPDSANRINLDGANDVEPFTGGVSITPILDTLQEFKVQVGTYSAEYGLGGALVVDAVTKSGTNEFHGSVWDYYRNEALDAPPFFARTIGTEKIKAPLIRNQYGLVVGGPIKKNRTFFFGAYEGLKLPGSNTYTGNLPTLAERNGDFSKYSTVIKDPITHVPFPNNAIPTTQLDPSSLKMANALFADPNNSNPSRDWIIAQPNNLDQYNLSVRVDHQINQHHNAFLRYSLQNSNQDTVASYSMGMNLKYGDALNTFRGMHAVLGETSSLTAALVNTFTLSYNRSVPFLGSPAEAFDSFGGCIGLGLQVPQCRTGFKNGGLVGLTIGTSQFFTGAATTLSLSGAPPIHSTSQTFQLQDNLSWSIGAHTFKLGVDIQRQLAQSFSDNLPGANFSQAFTGDRFTDFLMGVPTSLNTRLDTASTSDLHNMYYAGYAQHDWKVTPTLTVNMGVRYEVATPIIEIHGYVGQFDPALGIDNSPYLVQKGDCPADPRACGGILYPRQNVTAAAFYHNIRPDIPYGIMPDKDSPFDTDGNNWAPRFGLAWRPFGGTRTVVRAGYGINYYFKPLLNFARFIGAIPPASVTAAVTSSPTVPTLTWNSLVQNPAGGVSLTQQYSTNVAVGRENLNPYVQQRSVSISHEVARNTVIELQYVGSKSTHTQMSIDLEMAPCLSGPGATCPGGFGTTPVAGRLPFDKFNQLAGYYYGGFGSYNGGIVTFRRGLANGLMFTSSYTYSKDMGGGGGYIQSGDGNALANPTARQEFKYRSGDDATHSASALLVWDLPFGPGRQFGSSVHHALRLMIGGWQMSDIFVAHSGLPTYMQTNKTFCNNAASPAIRCFPNRTGSPNDVLALSNGVDGPRYLVANFPEPNNNFGNSGENILTNNGMWNNDWALNKTTNISERVRTEFRFEAFNVFNHPIFPSGLGANPSSPATFGRVSSSGAQRDLQLGVKIHF